MGVFMAGVGTAEIFKIDKNGQEHLFSTAKTLTESGITIGVSAEDIRAGAGAKLYGKYFHTSTFDLKMTDAMFKLEYIAANVGAEIDIGGDVFKTSIIKSDRNGKIKLTDAVAMTCNKDVYVYAKLPTDEFYRTYKLDDERQITVENPSLSYCVKYLYTNDNAKILVVKASFVPDTLRVYLTMNLFSGDDKNPSTGTKIGTVTVLIPRFLLNGTQDLSMSMTGASTTSFEGSALASAGGCTDGCEDESIYAKIIEVVDGYSWQNEAVGICFDTSREIIEDAFLDEYVDVYAYFFNMKPKRLTEGEDYILQNAKDSESSLTIDKNHISGAVNKNAKIEAIGLNKLDIYKSTKEYIYEEIEYGMLSLTILNNFVLA